MTDLDEYENKLDELVTDHASFPRVFFYFSELFRYLAEGEDEEKWRSLYRLALKTDHLTYAIVIAMKLHDVKLLEEVYSKVEVGSPEERQLAFVMAETQQRIPDFQSHEIMSGSLRSSLHLKNAEFLDVLEPKSPEDVFKTHLVETRNMAGFDPPAQVDSILENLAKTFVSAIVNCGFGTDTLILKEESDWVFRHKEAGITCAVAAIGSIMLWDVETGSSSIDIYNYSDNPFAKAGALLGVGVMSAGVCNEFDTAFGLLQDHLSDEDTLQRCCAYLGLGIAYSCTARVELDMLPEPLMDPEENMEVVAMSALSCGMVFAGTANDAIEQAIFQVLNSRGASEHITLPLISVALGLVYLQTGSTAQKTIEDCKDLPEGVRDYTAIAIEACAYAGTGNVLVIQHMLEMCVEPHKESAVLGVALVAMGEKIGTEMALRHFERMIQYGTPEMKKWIPIALGVLSVGNPTLGALPFLSRMTHDASKDVCYSAMLGLGIMAAGTNNGATAKLFRELSAYHAKDAKLLFICRIGQALVHLGKGTLTLSPLMMDGHLVCRPGLVGLITFAHVIAHTSDYLLAHHQFLLYTLYPAIRTRCMTVVGDDNMSKEVSLRIGQATDVAGLPGKPNVVTGFQTMTSPVVLQAGQRIEITDLEWEPISDICEGVVVVKKRVAKEDNEKAAKSSKTGEMDIEEEDEYKNEKSPKDL
ncbi:putative proteasome 26S subunit [Monocercomonoides exilis]|uniref:putative proteasome 26S subunit n=1 Tax=Monocercomonoides exilis TaxID=2049356 RepID=UPI00355AB3BE|nr:putative proteasome 26S subunit [Monocercomonoides exilis]|eukprot:MONOS_13161.1-p1 / transcript=MONOS_13161.1 / gene=MONOS_13161 / organism=Monocercomonoides_exilis_PA203 / gene_product=proteasome 26S subunit / transcript_product=proteasome 26S subunit / location=Mono_scaffold00784:13171-16906(+) / protein_length=698 / sequence_SO=supercontig / SO=protein_coding / is_pseudo=false